VSLFSITCRRCGGKIGGPETFCQGTDGGISWENPPEYIYMKKKFIKKVI